MFMWGRSSSASDLAAYRAHYPGKRDDLSSNKNVDFYLNIIPAKPEGFKIEELHRSKWTDVDWLEDCHSYIQWLFPIQEPGLNPSAQVLMGHEIEVMRANDDIMKRIWSSFRMMVNFYGMQVEYDRDAVAAGIIPKNHQSNKDCRMPWRPSGPNLYVFSRLSSVPLQSQLYENLNVSSHNYLRITRILKCLGELGMEDVKLSWLVFFAQEVFEAKALYRCGTSLVEYWSGTIYDEDDRRAYLQWVQRLAEGGDRGRQVGEKAPRTTDPSK
jgi:hypothetical protein